MARRGRRDRSGQALDLVHRIAVRSALQLLEDRRLWHPERDYRPALSFGRRSRLVVARPRRAAQVASGYLPHRIAFDVPKRVAICVRRKERREVLFASGKGGGRVSRRRRRNFWSDVRC